MLKTGVFATFSRCFITGNYLLSIKYQIDKIVSWKKIANALIVLATVLPTAHCYFSTSPS